MVRHQTLIVDGATKLLGPVTLASVPEAICSYVDERMPPANTAETVAAFAGACDRLSQRESELTAMCDRLKKLEADLTTACARVSAREAALAAKPPPAA